MGVILRSHRKIIRCIRDKIPSLQLRLLLKAAVVIASSLHTPTGFPWLFSKDLFCGGPGTQIVSRERNDQLYDGLPRACGIQECLRSSRHLPDWSLCCPLNYNTLVHLSLLQCTCYSSRRGIWYLPRMGLGMTRLSLSNYFFLLDSSSDV